VAFLFLVPTTSARLAATFLKAAHDIAAMADSTSVMIQNIDDPTRKLPFSTRSGFFVLMNLMSLPRFLTSFLTIPGTMTLTASSDSLPLAT
jgi:hypothetical protein